jgi:type III pantothenate kinase
MNLLIDIGNTRLKWATSNNLDILPRCPLANTAINRYELRQLWQDIAPPDQIAISCVSSSQLFDLVRSVINELWPGVSIFQAKSVRSAFGVINAYQQPEKLGVDRWLGLIASYHRHQKGFCLVGCGTAITLDVVDDSGKHLGGLISPGLRLMKESLAKGTENLGLNETIYPLGLATNTDSAIYGGTLSAACGLIERLFAKQQDTPQFILTGGDAEIIAPHLSIPVILDPNLTLRGLALTLQKTP